MRRSSTLHSIDTIVERQIGADKYDDIIAVGQNLEAIEEINAHIADIQTANANIADIAAVADSIAGVDAVAASIADVNTVAGVITDIVAVADNAAAVTAVGGSITSVVDVANAIDDVVVVATDIASANSDIKTTANSINNVNLVAGSINNVNTVAGGVSTIVAKSADITTVAAVATKVATVADAALDVMAIADNLTSVNTVASDILHVKAVATTIVPHITEILAADDNAVAAAASATVASNKATEAEARAVDASNAALIALDAKDDTIGYAALASTHASNAEIQAQLAEMIKTATADIYDEFDDRYLGAYANDPLVDNDGDTLMEGALYWNTNHNTLKIYNGVIWEDPVGQITTAAAIVGSASATLIAAAEVVANVPNLVQEAEHWANYAEDTLVPEGNMVDEYSAKHWATKAGDALTTVLANTVEAEHWANYPEDSLVPEGNLVDEYSARHYSKKAHTDAVQVALDRAAIEAIFDNFDDRYLGAHAVDPTVDNDGNPLMVGALYWNTTESTVKFWNGGIWESPELTASQAASDAFAAKVLAEAAATAAASDKAAVEAIYDSFDDRYLGAKAAAPTLDNDGNPLVTGALYWDTTTSKMYAWNGTAWSRTTFDLTETVTSFNTRQGAVVLTLADVTAAVGVDLSGVEPNAKDDQLASEVPYNNTTSSLVATTVQGAIDEIEARVDVLETIDHSHTNQAILDATTASFTTADKTKLDGIETGATADQIASEVPVTPTGNLVATNVQSALVEIQTELDKATAVVGTSSLVRHDKILASKNVIQMLYNGNGDLEIVRYTGDDNTSVFYRDVLTYTGSNLTSVKHFNGTIDTITASGTTTLTYDGSDNLLTATYTE